MKKIFKKDIKKIPFSIFLLMLIILVGAFFRTYHFRDWLYFYPDQARDLVIVKDYLTSNAPLPLLGFKAASTKFELGAMYYYFQIISGKIFGIAPQTMAYPDLILNLLSIPLFYLFFQKLFKKNIALILTGLYSISFYSIEYSRFAWNPNPMPFFVLLFLLGLWELLVNKKETSWIWLVIIGMTLGVGVQLHTILFYLFPVVSLACFVKLSYEKQISWKQLAMIFLIAIVLNTNQIVSEIEHNFFNTRQLFQLSVGATQSHKITDSIALDVICHAQANAHIISSLGNKLDCDFFDLSSKYLKKQGIIKTTNLILLQDSSKRVLNIMFIGIVASLLFSFIGYGLLVYFYRKHSDSKTRTMLGLIIFYATVSFAVLIPVVADAPLRYYLQVFFVPYLFLGLFFQLILKKNKKLLLLIVVFIFGFLAVSNLETIFAEANLYASQMHSNPRYVVLGELENMTDFVQKSFGNTSLVYIIGDDRSIQNYFKPFAYTFSERNIVLSRVSKRAEDFPVGKPIFYIGKDDSGKMKEINGLAVTNYKKFGEMGIYILNNK